MRIRSSATVSNPSRAVHVVAEYSTIKIKLESINAHDTDGKKELTVHLDEEEIRARAPGEDGESVKGTRRRCQGGLAT